MRFSLGGVPSRLVRYLVRDYLIMCVVAYVSLLAFFSLFEFAEFVRIVAQGKREFALVWRLTAWDLTVMSSEVGPLSLLLAVTLFGATLSRRGEIVAIFGAGISPVRVLLPLVAATALVAIGFYYVNDRLAPRGVREMENVTINELKRMSHKERYFLRHRHWFHVGEKFVRVGDVEAGEKRYRDFTVLDIRDGHLQARYHADIVHAEGSELSGEEVAIERFPLGDTPGQADLELDRAEHMLMPVARHFNAFLDMSSKPQKMTHEQLQVAAEARRLQGYDPRSYETEYHSRLWFPLSIIGLVLLAATYSFRVDVKRSLVRALVELLGLTVVAFVVRQIFRSLAIGNFVPPMVGASGPFLTFSAVAVWRLRSALRRPS